MNRHVTAGRDVVAVDARDAGRRESFFLARAVDADAIEITLRCVFR